jgi:hypothetical protein
MERAHAANIPHTPRDGAMPKPRNPNRVDARFIQKDALKQALKLPQPIPCNTALSITTIKASRSARAPIVRAKAPNISEGAATSRGRSIVISLISRLEDSR